MSRLVFRGSIGHRQPWVSDLRLYEILYLFKSGNSSVLFIAQIDLPELLLCKVPRLQQIPRPVKPMRLLLPDHLL